jgi:hypothetical protein
MPGDAGELGDLGVLGDLGALGDTGAAEATSCAACLFSRSFKLSSPIFQFR